MKDYQKIYRIATKDRLKYYMRARKNTVRTFADYKISIFIALLPVHEELSRAA
jgi:hypothetical protein